MDIGFTLVAELLLLGTVAGFLAGLLGVGGGMMMVPFMTFILSRRGVESGLAVKMAIATSMATILFTSISSVRAHHKLGRAVVLRRVVPFRRNPAIHDGIDEAPPLRVDGNQPLPDNF